ncbi:MAG: hypothetical protein ACLPV2_18500 [Steroidobacteraceae bacterium]
MSDWRHLRRPWRDYQAAARKCDVPTLVLWLGTNAVALGLLGPTGGVQHYKSLRARLHAVTAAARAIVRADGRGFVDRIAEAPEFARTHYDDEITGWRGMMVERDAAMLQEWNKWSSENKKGASTLKYLMYSSALSRVDVSKIYENLWSDEERASDPAKKESDALRKKYYDDARRRYDALGDQGRRLYNSIRNNYNFQRRQAIYEEERSPPVNSLDAHKPIKMAALPSTPRRFWRALAILAVLYMGALYLNHQAHACFVLRGYSVYQDNTGYHVCKVRPWYWFW